jgi:hypothetical protein
VLIVVECGIPVLVFAVEVAASEKQFGVAGIVANPKGESQNLFVGRAVRLDRRRSYHRDSSHKK